MADRIKEIVARKLDRGIKDPRLGFVTVTDVRVTGDLQHASIFYTVYGTDEERADTAAALKSATGMLRSEVGKNITARLTPSLEFILDGVPENAAAIDALLEEARRHRVERARVPDLAGAGEAARAGDEVVARPLPALVDEEQAARGGGRGAGGRGFHGPTIMPCPGRRPAPSEALGLGSRASEEDACGSVSWVLARSAARSRRRS